MEYMIDEPTGVAFYFCHSCGRLWEFAVLILTCKKSLFQAKEYMESDECPNCHVPTEDELLDWLDEISEEPDDIIAALESDLASLDSIG